MKTATKRDGQGENIMNGNTIYTQKNGNYYLQNLYEAIYKATKQEYTRKEIKKLYNSSLEIYQYLQPCRFETFEIHDYYGDPIMVKRYYYQKDDILLAIQKLAYARKERSTQNLLSQLEYISQDYKDLVQVIREM